MSDSTPDSAPGSTTAMIPFFHRGTWTEAPDPFPDDWEDWDDAVRAAGFDRTVRITAGSDEQPLAIEVAPPGLGTAGAAFLLAVTVSDRIHPILAGDVVDLMELLRQWTPTVQAVTVLGLLERLDRHVLEAFDEQDLVAMLGARAAFGVDRAERWEDQASKFRRELHATKVRRGQGQER